MFMLLGSSSVMAVTLAHQGTLMVPLMERHTLPSGYAPWRRPRVVEECQATASSCSLRLDVSSLELFFGFGYSSYRAHHHRDRDL